MNRGLGTLVIIGIIVWLFLLWDRGEQQKFEAQLENIDNAETADRCLEFRQDAGDGEWSLGYSGRLRQLARGCF